MLVPAAGQVQQICRRAPGYAAGVAEAQQWDVLIVGAGPAGLAAAQAAAARGARTLVVERAAHPRYKTCGGGLIGFSLAAAGRADRGAGPGHHPRGHRHAARAA